jgi:CrcB protein
MPTVPYGDDEFQAAPVDPDVDLSDPQQLAETRPREWDVLLAVSAGGVLGAEARYGLGRALTHPVGDFPWSTLLINVSGCLVIGILMAWIFSRPGLPRLTRPFLGTGILGGYTTYSTFAVDVQQLLRVHHVGTAIGYLVATVALGAVAVAAAFRLTGRAIAAVAA